MGTGWHRDSGLVVGSGVADSVLALEGIVDKVGVEDSYTCRRGSDISWVGS
jgi:hypothetical protein